MDDRHNSVEYSKNGGFLLAHAELGPRPGPCSGTGGRLAHRCHRHYAPSLGEADRLHTRPVVVDEVRQDQQVPEIAVTVADVVAQQRLPVKPNR